MKKPNQDCPISQLFETIGKKWVIFIIKTIGEGESTFTSIKESLGDLNSKILTDRLDELETKWYILRDIVSTKPIKIRYSLTQFGKELLSHIWVMAKRASKNWKCDIE